MAIGDINRIQGATPANFQQQRESRVGQAQNQQNDIRNQDQNNANRINADNRVDIRVGDRIGAGQSSQNASGNRINQEGTTIASATQRQDTVEISARNNQPPPGGENDITAATDTGTQGANVIQRTEEDAIFDTGGTNQSVVNNDSAEDVQNRENVASGGVDRTQDNQIVQIERDNAQIANSAGATRAAEATDITNSDRVGNSVDVVA